MSNAVDGDPRAAESGDALLDEARRLLIAAESELAELGTAIARLGLGTHAVCAVCGAPIEVDRLLASPGDARCPLHAAAG